MAINDTTTVSENSLLNLKGIVWIASYPKSGNTWMRMLLQNYILGCSDINANVGLAMSDTNVHNYQCVSPWAFGSMVGLRHTAQFRTAALMNMMASSIKKSVCYVKTHCANIIVDQQPLIPQALTRSAVYLVRDPRDVAVSYARHLNEPVDKVIKVMHENTNGMYTADKVMAWPMDWSLNVKSWTHTNFPCRVVRYEDIVADPLKEFGDILNFLAGGHDGDKLKNAVELSSFENLKEQERKSGFIERQGSDTFFTTGKAGGWKEVLTPEQAKRIETDHEEQMKVFGYGS